jgi:hypothetical protein
LVGTNYPITFTSTFTLPKIYFIPRKNLPKSKKSIDSNNPSPCPRDPDPTNRETTPVTNIDDGQDGD